jgi:hypothetical protein
MLTNFRNGWHDTTGLLLVNNYVLLPTNGSALHTCQNIPVLPLVHLAQNTQAKIEERGRGLVRWCDQVHRQEGEA